MLGKLAGLIASVALVVACGGETETSEGSKASRPGASSESANGGGGGSETGDGDVPATDDACSVARPGTAKGLPEGLSVPAGANGLTLRFQLRSKRVELAQIVARDFAPTWTSKDTQIFALGTTSGAWIETRNEAGELTYQQSLHDPLGRTVEAFPDPNDPNGEFKNDEVCTDQAEISVEVPAGAAEVRLYASERASSATELVAWYRLR